MMASSFALDMALLARNSAASNEAKDVPEAKVKAESDLLRSPLGGHNPNHHNHQGERMLPFSITNILSQQQVLSLDQS